MGSVWNLVLGILIFLSSAIAITYAGAVIQQPPPPDPVTVAFLQQVFTVLSGMGGMGAMLKISSLITLLIASTKVGALKSIVWDRLGKSQPWVAPFLGLLAGVAGLGAGGAAVTPALVLVYVVAGGGAVFLHELLDSLKGVPGIGALYTSAISRIDLALGGPAPVTTEPAKSQDSGTSER